MPRAAFDAEWLSRELQRDAEFPSYLTPIVAGVGEGGTLAEMILDGAPPATIAGAVSLDPAEIVASQRPICSAPPATSRRGFSVRRDEDFAGLLVGRAYPRLSTGNRDYVMALRREGAPLELHEIAPDPSMGDALRTLIEPHLAKPNRAPANLRTSRRSFRAPLTTLGVEHPIEPYGGGDFGRRRMA